MIFTAVVRGESVHVQAGVLTLEMSSTSLMSFPAIGFGTEGVMATSLASQGPEGATARVAGSSSFLPWCSPGVVGPCVRGAPEVVGSGAGVVSATFRAASPDDPSLEPPSIFAIPTTSSRAMPTTISRRTQ